MAAENSRKLNPKLMSFQQWLDAHAKQVPLG